MEFIGNATFWDEKFDKRESSLLGPEGMVVKYSELLKPGTVLDIACGDGRNTMFLADKGFEVTGVDFSEKALDRLNKFANEFGHLVKTKQVDLSKPTSIEALGIYDNMIVSHYRLTKESLKVLKDHLTSEGILIVTGFGHKHVCDDRIRTNDLIYQDDFLVLKEDFELLNYEESIDERGFFTTYVFQKKIIFPHERGENHSKKKSGR